MYPLPNWAKAFLVATSQTTDVKIQQTLKFYLPNPCFFRFLYFVTIDRALRVKLIFERTYGKIRELKYREALLLPRHVEFWTSGASSDRRYFSDKQKLFGCPHVIVYMCAHGWNELPILVLYVTWSHTLLLINSLIVHTWYRRKRSSETVNK